MGWFDRWFGARRGPPPEPPALTGEAEEGWCDCGFSIQRSWVEGGTRVFHGVARDGDVTVAVDVALDRRFKVADFGPDFPGPNYQGTVRLRSAGAPSDALLRALDREFGTELAPARMVNERTLTAISLTGDPRHLDRGLVEIKLFHEPENDDEYDERYFEWYLNITLADGRLELNEKDQEYRAAIVRVLGGG